MDPQMDLSRLEKLFLALCDQTRLRLLSLMAKGPVSVGYLAEKLGESQPKISRHLAYLRTAGLVYTSREGKWVYYGVQPQADQAVGAILSATIATISGHPGNMGSPNRSAIQTGLEADAGGGRRPVMPEWRPNHIDVHLL
jgi:DNA-binding transcriptional ArsR family regulator